MPFYVVVQIPFYNVYDTTGTFLIHVTIICSVMTPYETKSFLSRIIPTRAEKEVYTINIAWVLIKKLQGVGDFDRKNGRVDPFWMRFASSWQSLFRPCRGSRPVLLRLQVKAANGGRGSSHVEGSSTRKYCMRR